MNELELRGLNGNNLLAFMAAVGTLRVLTQERPEWDPRLMWLNRGVWKPALSFSTEVTAADLVDSLHCYLSERTDAPEFNWSQDLAVSPDVFRALLIQAIDLSDWSSRSFVDWCAAFGSEAISVKDKIGNTHFKVTAGQQKFVGILKTLSKETEKRHIEKSLFQEWQYKEKGDIRTLRWDPSDDRRYAYRADNPSEKKSTYPQLAERGANRLALEAIPCFPTAPTSKGLATTAFSTHDKKISFSWPIWQYPARLDSVRSLLSHPELTAHHPRRARVAPIGIVEVFRSIRIIGNKYYGNFTPSQPCLY